MTRKRFFILSLAIAGLFAIISAISGNNSETISKTLNAGENSSSGISIHSLQDEVVSVSKKAKKSVAFIKVIKKARMISQDQQFYDYFDRFFGNQGRMAPRYNPKSEALGTGFVIDEKEGYIVTNNHVIADADSLTVTIDGKTFKAKAIGTDPKTDVGLIKIENFKKGDIIELKFADSDKVEVGNFAIAIGNPFGLNQTVTFGIVSAKGRANVNVAEYENFIQTDAAINPGNSGGPLLDINGNVMGMNTAIFSKSGGYMGIGFAVPSNMIKSVIVQLKQGGTVKRAQMGVIIQPLTDDLKKHLGIDENQTGILVSSVAENSPASKAGIENGDVIYQFDNKNINSVAELRNQVAFAPIDKDITIKIIREGKKLEKNIRLTETREDQFISKNEYYSKNFGIKLTSKNENIEVSGVDNNSLAEMAGLQPGDIVEAINKKRITSLKSAAAILENSKSAMLLINRNENQFYVVVNR